MGGVTVVVVNWNGGEWLRKCLESLVSQEVKPEFVIVVDNDSSDGSEACVSDFPGFRLIRSGGNLGFAAANNIAFRDCKTEFVALLNPDAIAEPGWLAALLRAAEGNPTCASFGSRQLVAENPLLLDGLGDSYHCSGMAWRAGHGRLQRTEDLQGCEVFSVCAAAALYRRSMLEEVGGFDEAHFCYLEDVDLGFRLRLAGYSSIYVPDAVVKHVGSATSGGEGSDFVIYHGHRNIVWTYFKNMPGFLFWLFLPAHIAMNLYLLLRFASVGRHWVIFRAKRDAIKGLPSMWKKRKAIQAARRASIYSVAKFLEYGWSRK